MTVLSVNETLGRVLKGRGPPIIHMKLGGGGISKCCSGRSLEGEETETANTHGSFTKSGQPLGKRGQKG